MDRHERLVVCPECNEPVQVEGSKRRVIGVCGACGARFLVMPEGREDPAPMAPAPARFEEPPAPAPLDLLSEFQAAVLRDIHEAAALTLSDPASMPAAVTKGGLEASATRFECLRLADALATWTCVRIQTIAVVPVGAQLLGVFDAAGLLPEGTTAPDDDLFAALVAALRDGWAGASRLQLEPKGTVSRRRILDPQATDPVVQVTFELRNAHGAGTARVIYPASLIRDLLPAKRRG